MCVCVCVCGSVDPTQVCSKPNPKLSPSHSFCTLTLISKLISYTHKTQTQVNFQSSQAQYKCNTQKITLLTFFNFNFIRKNLYEKKGRAWFWSGYPWVKIQIVIKYKCLVGIRIQVFLINVFGDPTQTQFNILKSRYGIMAQPNHVTNFHAI